MSFKVKFSLGEHKIGNDFWLSKKQLFESFYGDFYDFILSKNGEKDLRAKNINSKEDFYAYADWYADGQENCYAMGFAFHDYFLTAIEGGKMEEQPTDTFIGYCYHNGKYLDFLNFLVTFFAWWRNDEHCTCFDPYNRADEFCNSNWAVLVDTSKLFYFTAETVFGWQSFRVKYAIDNIPGTFKTDYQEEITYEEEAVLPRLRVAGYEFEGWFDENGNLVTKASGDIEVVAKFKRKDIYNYWEKEEKTIKKVFDPARYKRVDPA